MTDEDFKDKSLVDLLDMLEPIQEPPAISMWPQTQGWVFLGLAVLVLVVWLGLKWREHRRANAYRRAALVELARAGDDPIAIAAILRRTAMAGFPRVDVAGLSGETWLAFLDRTYGGAAFMTEIGRQMVAAPYQAAAPTSISGLAAIAQDWVHSHRPKETS